MAAYEPEQIRNIALIGHGNCGKTTLCEAMLFASGAVSRMGKVDEGTTRTDYDPEEISRKISVNTVPATFEWKEKQFTVLDTPGFLDFLPEVNVVLPAADGAVLVVDALNGVEGGTEKTFEFARAKGMPTIVFINKLDKENANFDKAFESLKKELDGNFAPCIRPTGTPGNYTGFVDIAMRKAYKFDAASGEVEEIEPEGEMKEAIEQYREDLVEAAANVDDALADKYLEGEEISDEELLESLRRGVLSGQISPVLCGIALNAVGVAQLLDLCVNYLPSPADRSFTARKGEEEVDVGCDAPFTSAFVFKTLSEAHLGDLVLVRVVSGELKPGETVENPGKGVKEKLGSMYQLCGKERKEVSSLSAGQIGALVKLKATRTGDTLVSEGAGIVFECERFPEPLMSFAVYPASKADQEKLSNAVTRLTDEDPSVRVRYDTTTKETLVEGMGEVQLDIFIKRLKERFKVNVDVKKPKIAYLETIRKTAEAQGRHKKQTGGRGQFGDVHIRYEPLERGSGIEFVDAIVGGVVPGKFVPAVEKGLREAAEHGVLAGYPCTDFKATLYDGSHHPVDSSELAFKMAASLSYKAGIAKADPVLLEPIMQVEVVVPEEYMGDVMGDLNSRRGKIQGMERKGKKQVIKALVPLAEMYRYIVSLRSMTAGRGEYTMKFSHYEEVPPNIQEQVIEEARKEQEKQQ